MAWRKNKKLSAQGFRDLEYLPKDRHAWDFTLASLAFAARRTIDGRPPDLNDWAARHGVPASSRYRELGPEALVLWHGTSRARAEKIAEHGLFRKRGLWTTTDPNISHSYCRNRSERFATDGAVVCIVLDQSELVEGREYGLEGNGDIYRFHCNLAPEVVEYVLLNDEIRFAGQTRARRPSPWPRAKFKRQSGDWVPVQSTPVRYSDSASYSSQEELVAILMARILEGLEEVSAVEIFSVLYAAVTPARSLEHDAVFELIDEHCTARRRRGKVQTFRSRAPSTRRSGSRR